MVTHEMVEIETWKSLASVSSATATMVVSRIAMMVPSTTTIPARTTSGSSRSSAAGAPMLAMASR